MKKNDLPSGWRVVELGDVLNIQSSKRIFAKEYVNSGVAFFRSKEIIEKHKGNIISTPLYISEKRFKEIENKFGVPKHNDILLTSVGTLGVPYKVQKDEIFYFKDGNLTWFKEYKDCISPDFLYIWFTSLLAKQAIDNITIGSTQQAITISALKTIKINLPSLSEQKAIAHILGKLDDKIALNRQINQTLETMAQTLFKSWFVNFDPVIDNALKAGNPIPDPLKTQAEKRKTTKSTLPKTTQNLFPNRFVFNNKLKKWIPEGWEVKNLGKVVEIKRGKNITKSNFILGTIPVIAGGMKPAGFHNKSNATQPVITVSSSGANAGFIKLNLTNIWASDCSFISKDFEDNVYYFYHWLSLRQKQIFDMQTGSAQPHIYPKDLNRLQIIIPSENIVNFFESISKTYYKRNSLMNNETQTLTKLRDTLLPKLISGKIQV